MHSSGSDNFNPSSQNHENEVSPSSPEHSLDKKFVDKFMKTSSNREESSHSHQNSLSHIFGRNDLGQIHVIRDPSELDKIAEVIADKLQNRLQDYYEIRRDFALKIEKRQEGMKAVVREAFQRFYEAMKESEEAMLRSIDEDFDKKNEEIQKILDYDKNAEESVMKKIICLRTKDYSESSEYSGYLTESLPTFKTTQEFIVLEYQMRVQNKEFYSRKLDDLMLSLKDKFKEIKFPMLEEELKSLVTKKQEERMFVVKERLEEYFIGGDLVFFNAMDNNSKLRISFEQEETENRGHKQSLKDLRKVKKVTLDFSKTIYKKFEETVCLLNCLWGYLENIQHVTFIFGKGGIFKEELGEIVSLRFCDRRQIRTTC